jgi:hypothetical protein
MTVAPSPDRLVKPPQSPTDRGRLEANERVRRDLQNGDGGSRKKKVTISLSQRSVRAFEELKQATDADTDSEVFRNALRLHLTLLRAHLAGVRLFMKRDGSEECVPVTLFTADE